MAPIVILLALGLIPVGHAQAQVRSQAQLPARAPAQAQKAPAPKTQESTASRQSPVPRSQGATTIYHAVLPDGTVFVGDRRPQAATSVETLSYPFPQGERIDARAQAEREYWQQQAEAFKERKREREREEAEQRWIRELGRTVAQAMPDAYYVGPVVRRHSAAPPPFYIPIPVVPGLPAVVAPRYTSSPGAVQGRDAAFIGSGFQRSR